MCVHACVWVWWCGLPPLPQLSSSPPPPPPSFRMPLKIHSPREESNWLNWGHAHTHQAGEGGAP